MNSEYLIDKEIAKMTVVVGQIESLLNRLLTDDEDRLLDKLLDGFLDFLLDNRESPEQFEIKQNLWLRIGKKARERANAVDFPN